MTVDETLDELEAALPDARARARRGGSMHPLWEAIFDAEAILRGEPNQAILTDPNEVLDLLKR